MRTHQDIARLRTNEPPLARDFVPAVIDTAAMPVRVEQWLAAGRLEYRITGIVWGGAQPTNALQIRFNANPPGVPLGDPPLPPSTAFPFVGCAPVPPAPRCLGVNACGDTALCRAWVVRRLTYSAGWQAGAESRLPVLP